MKIAVLTQAYNESFNLPIWVEHYARSVGRENLYVIDHGSTDGSTSRLEGVNVIRAPRTPFEDKRKSAALSAMHAMLLQFFDVVIVCDCDELVVPDPEFYENLRAYIEETKPVAVAPVGLQIHHVIDREPPLDLGRPILSQRRLGFFTVPNCKPSISSVGIVWQAGQHVSSVKPALDPRLFMFHTKFVDYNVAMGRHAINKTNEWSEAQSLTRHGAHHRYEYERFVREGFLVPINVVTTGNVKPFDFDAEIAAMTTGMVQHGAMFHLGPAEPKFVEIPSRFHLAV